MSFFTSLLGPWKSTRELKPFGFREFSDIRNSTNYKTGRFREGSETHFPKLKPDFLIFARFWTLNVFGIGFRSLHKTGHFRIIQQPRKNLSFAGLWSLLTSVTIFGATRCPCHQHLYLRIFCANVISVAFSSYVLALAKNLHKKCTRKTVVKSTVGKSLYPNHHNQIARVQIPDAHSTIFNIREWSNYCLKIWKKKSVWTLMFTKKNKQMSIGFGKYLTFSLRQSWVKLFLQKKLEEKRPKCEQWIGCIVLDHHKIIAKQLCNLNFLMEAFR